jgi:hypothetical protein
MAKRVFVVLIAVNALLVLFLSMQKDIEAPEEKIKSFVSKGETLSVIDNKIELRSSVQQGVCKIVGPVLDVSIARQIMRRLRGKNISTDVIEKEDVVSRDYWVLIPPRASEKQALRLLKQLQLSNIDSYIVTQGDYANAISLGLFTVKASAYKIKKEMLEAGFDVSVQEILRSQKRFWLRLYGDSSALEYVITHELKDFENKVCKVLD